jgi:hypothetical protein
MIDTIIATAAAISAAVAILFAVLAARAAAHAASLADRAIAICSAWEASLRDRSFPRPNELATSLFLRLTASISSQLQA